MAAKKKAPKKKAAKKKSSTKKAAKKKTASPKKTVKKKAAKRAIDPKKIAPKKKAAPKKPGTRSAPARVEVATTRDISTREPVLTLLGISLDFTFQRQGEITATHFSAGQEVDEKTIGSTGRISFDTAKKGDVISINGAVAGDATLVLSRNTNPPSPRRYPEGGVFDNLIIL